MPLYSSSSSVGTATSVGFGLLSYRWIFSARRLLQSAVASGTSNPQLGRPVIRAFQLPPPGVSHVWNDASEPQQRKVELWARNFREFCRKWRVPRHFWVLLHADGFTSPPKEGALRIFSPEKSDGFGGVWTPRTWVPKASTLTSRPPTPLVPLYIKINNYSNFGPSTLHMCIGTTHPLTPDNPCLRQPGQRSQYRD